MSRPRRAVALTLATACVAALTSALVTVSTAGPAAALPDDTVVTVTGRGFGHGRGMGQYGALGYAVDYGESHPTILDRYYGGTRAADGGNPRISVQLTAWDAAGTGPGRAFGTLAASSPGNLYVEGTSVSGVTAVQVRPAGAGAWELLTADSCSGPFTSRQVLAAGFVKIRNIRGNSLADAVGLCEAAGSRRAYRGDLVVRNDPTSRAQQTLNEVPMEEYLPGVVPREMPASFADIGQGRGAAALRAQAVAARSYAQAERRRPGLWETCDTISCQVYGGAATVSASGALTRIEDDRSNAAVSATAGLVRRHVGGALDGQVARTEFSSSTGGWTTGGVFPAVQDLGDATSANPNRSWTVSLREGDLAARLGVADIAAIGVSQRNGLGADGGRVLTVTIDTGRGLVTLTGNQVRQRLGLKSDWFSFSGIASPSDGKFVDAVYRDFLGRDADLQGRAYWSGQVTGGRVSREGLALSFARSPEYLGRIVDDLYVRVLGRSADPQGRQDQIAALQRGASAAQLAVNFYASDEYFARAGGSVRLWVEDLYRQVLGRVPEAGGVDTWERETAARGRASTAAQFYGSTESRLLRVERLYVALLGRSADAAGRQTWTDALLSRDDVVLAGSLAGSEEYYQRAQRR